MRDVLLITIDSLRTDYVGCYGYDRNITPALDSFSQEACKMTNAFANGCSTPISFPSILSSTYGLHYGGYPPHNELSEERTLISEVLNDQGIETSGLHSNPHLFEELGYGRGFDYFFDSHSDEGVISHLRNYINNNLSEHSPFYKIAKKVYYLLRSSGFDPGLPYVRAEELTNRTIDRMTANNGTQFIWTHYMDVHNPFTPPEQIQQRVNGEVIERRRAIQLTNKLLDTPQQVTDFELEKLLQLYDAEIAYTDQQIGRLLETAESELENPLIIITADHGEEFTDHGGSAHGSLYDEVISVPLLVQDGKNTGVRDELVGLIDIAPTILDYLGLEAPDNYEGKSLKGIFEDEPGSRPPVLSHWGDPQDSFGISCRSKDEKHIFWSGKENELYDLNTDPEEKENLINERKPSKVLEEKIKSHKERILDEEKEAEDMVDAEMEERLSALGYK